MSPGQINLQVPETAARGQVNVVVATKDGTATATVTVADAAPAFSLFDAKYPAGVILTTDGSGSQGGGTYDFSGPPGRFVFPARAVKAGETILLFGVGFGCWLATFGDYGPHFRLGTCWSLSCSPVGC